MNLVRRMSVIGTLAAVTWTAREHHALAAGACASLTPPTECVGGALERQWTAGVKIGRRLTDQLWASTRVNQDPANWRLLVDAVTKAIPSAVASAIRVGGPSMSTVCRTQGLLDGSVCEMSDITPEPIQCVLDGIDWGKISSGLYCELSIAFDGLQSMPWFVRLPQDVCGNNFEESCDNIYEFGATRADPGILLPLVATELQARGTTDPTVEYWQGEACLPYTIAPFDEVFHDSMKYDCSYSY